MRVVRQLSLILENRPGVLAAVCADLARDKINIEGIYVENLGDHAIVRLVVSDPSRALHRIEAAGVLVFENEVLAISARDRPGSLATLASRLGKARLNIDYLYAGSPAKGKALIYLRVSDLARAKRALKGYR